MSRRVVFAPEAEDQLVDLYRYLARNATPEIAADYTDAIVTYCEQLVVFPHRGTAWDDIRPGLRTTTYKKHTVIAFAIDDNTIAVLGVFHRGRDYETLLRD